MIFNDIAFTIVVTTMMIVLLMAGAIITVIIANRRHVQQEVKIAQMAINYEKELRVVESEVQEQTLNNISRELHDNIGQLLTLMRIQMEQEKLDNPLLTDTLNSVDDTLTDTIQQVRMLSHSLNSEVLEQNGLLQMIKQEVKRLQQFKKLNVEWETDDKEPDLTKDQRIMAFRIFQEILNNILKHSKASNVLISLQSSPNFTLMVKDNGVGFDLQQIMRTGSGAGIVNMTKRAALAHMHFHIDTVVGQGSAFSLSQVNI